MLAADLPAARARAVRKGCACLGHGSTPTRHAFYVSVRCMCSHWRYVERARLADVVICTCRPGVLEKIVMLLRVPYMSE